MQSVPVISGLDCKMMSTLSQTEKHSIELRAKEIVDQNETLDDKVNVESFSM